MSDLVKRLRELRFVDGEIQEYLDEAADRIEELEELKEWLFTEHYRFCAAMDKIK